MDASDLQHFTLSPHSCFDPRRNSTAGIPSVFKAGSADSPNVLSPRSEQDFFLASAADADRTAHDLPSLVPSAYLTAALPLYSPSEIPNKHRNQSLTSAMETDMAFANANPVNFSLPTPPLSEPERLRLPSFNALGISAPHPNDVFRSPRYIPFEPTRDPGRPWQFASEMDVDTDFSVESPSAELRTRSAKLGGARPCLRRNTQILTPPDEGSDFQFTSDFIQAASPVDVEHQAVDLPGHFSEEVAEATGPSGEGVDVVHEDAPEAFAWLEEVVPVIISSLNPSSLVGQSPRLLSHALPSPSIPGHAFPNLIDKIRSTTSGTGTFTWINLLHAVPGRFNLADLPSSPPDTPGLPLGAGDDYFTIKTFESAVTAVDYDQGTMSTHLRAHQPLAAPSTIHLSIVERYIPPTSPNEFANLFNVKAPSLLVDRLVELVPGNGCLVFIYPTKEGAQTFMHDYVSPILDPLLRTVVIVNNFSTDLSTSLGRMTAVDRLHDFDTMRRKTVALCEELNGTTPSVRKRLHGTHGNYSLVYAEKCKVQLERKIWSDWWIKQEKPRIRAAVAQYYRLANRLPADAELMPYTVIQGILDDFVARGYPEGAEPSSKIEVGVFVVKRG